MPGVTHHINQDVAQFEGTERDLDGESRVVEGLKFPPVEKPKPVVNTKDYPMDDNPGRGSGTTYLKPKEPYMAEGVLVEQDEVDD
ncbi:MAG: hypothetical protein LBL47_01390 [Lactobacillus sp.]|nr:hypothetical protein [Lactobacillus sp.]